MFIALFAEALMAEPPALNLNLVCEGQYADVEQSVGNMSAVVDGQVRSGSSMVSTRVMRHGTAHLTFQGAQGSLTYPDGRQRTLENVAADKGKVTAEYRRKALLRTITWDVEVNRLTGMVRVSSGRDIAFAGDCTPESTQPKF